MALSRIKFEISNDYTRYKADGVYVVAGIDGTISLDFFNEIHAYPEYADYEDGRLLRIGDREFGGINKVFLGVSITTSGLKEMIKRMDGQYRIKTGKSALEDD